MLTGITPVYIDSPDRLENVLNITPYQIQYGGFDRIIVAEFGTEPRLAHLIDEAVDYLFIRGSEWNKGKVVNSALHWVHTEFCAVLDSDVFCPGEQVRTCLEPLRNRDAVIMCPYDTFHFCSRLPGLQIIRQSIQLDCGDYAQKYSKHHFSKGCVGGIMLARTAFLKYMRGISELFYGWGHEDSEFGFRASKMGNFMRVHGPLIHFDHERTDTSSEGVHFDANRSEMAKIYDMSRQEMLAYYGISDEESEYFSTLRPVKRSDLVARAQQLETGTT